MDYELSRRNLTQQERAWFEKKYPLCPLCDSDKDFNLHHIDGNRSNNWWENFVRLCSECHNKIHTLAEQELSRREAVAVSGIETSYIVKQTAWQKKANPFIFALVESDCQAWRKQ